MVLSPALWRRLTGSAVPSARELQVDHWRGLGATPQEAHLLVRAGVPTAAHGDLHQLLDAARLHELVRSGVLD